MTRLAQHSHVTFWHIRLGRNIIHHVPYSSDHSRIVRSFSIDADAIKFRVGWVYGNA